MAECSKCTLGTLKCSPSMTTISKSTWMEHTNIMTILATIVALLLVGLPQGDSAVQSPVRCNTVHEVGGVHFVWEVVPRNTTYYARWALSIAFETGDCLQFNRFTSGFLSALSQTDYSTCHLGNSTSPFYGAAGRPFLLQLTTATLDTVETYYIAEDDDSSCNSGMKFAVLVGPFTLPPAPQKSSTLLLAPGIIAAIVIGSLIFLCAGGFFLYCLCHDDD